MTEKSQLSLDLSRDGGVAPSPPAILVRCRPPTRTVVYDTYWRFAAKRQDVFFARLGGHAPPWTSDPILAQFKFTNAYRASDRVSQYLIREVIYRGSQAPREQFFRTMLFKLFNRISTWELLTERIGPLAWESYSFARLDRVLTQAMKKRQRVYSAAYIMPSARRFGHRRKHRNHLRLLEALMAARVPEQLSTCRTMREAFALLRSFPSMGDFLAYQFTIDLNYGTITSFSENDFVMPGPGARDGIRKCFADLGDFDEADIIRWTQDRQAREFEMAEVAFRDLWGRSLQLIDCQSLFCEVDKYARVAHPDVEGISGRRRIKQTFGKPKGSITAWYPPKWGINDRIPVSRT